jgi:hypothetical protein
MIFYLISLFWLCCAEGMRKLLCCWTKCVENEGDCGINVATLQPQYCVVKRYWGDTFLTAVLRECRNYWPATQCVENKGD